MKKLPTLRLRVEAREGEAPLKPFEWAEDDVGTRHQIGGEPTFIQAPDWPVCPYCRKTMSFYGQLDSLNDEFVIADCGMIYVFFCFDDNEAKAVVQSN